MGWHTLQYDSTLIKQLDNCKLIIRIGVGFDNVDLKTAGELGIAVSNVSLCFSILRLNSKILVFSGDTSKPNFPRRSLSC